MMNDTHGTAIATRTIVGQVVHGNAWGRVIGFPTANIVTSDLVSHQGIWAAIVTGGTLPAEGMLAAVSVGTRPTYYGDAGSLLLEAHVLDFCGDLYGQTLTVELRRLLRSELRFDDTPSLVAQLAVDVQDARDWYAAEQA